ncbi:hypothetical protein J3R03_004549 [Actinoplanes couchii]|nr:hypothetical protein [Actinoplanes couchii]
MIIYDGAVADMARMLRFYEATLAGRSIRLPY